MSQEVGLKKSVLKRKAKNKERSDNVKRRLRSSEVGYDVGGLRRQLKGKTVYSSQRQTNEVAFADKFLKSVDFSHTTVTFPTAGQWQVLNAPQLGDDRNNRIGRKISNKALQFYFALRTGFGTSANIPNNSARVMLVYDRQPNGAFPQLTDLLLAVQFDGSFNTSAQATNFVSLDTTNRFLVLFDWRVRLPAYSYDSSGNLVGMFMQSIDPLQPTCIQSDSIDLGGLTTKFNNSGGSGIATITSGALLLFTCCSQTPVTSSWFLDFNTRVLYYDR